MKAFTTENWAQIEAALDAMVDLPPEARPGWVDAQDLAQDMKAALHALLCDCEDHVAAVDNARKHVCDLLREEPVERIADFRIVRLLGEGGMATVYLAQREHVDYEQWVALKLIKSRSPSAEEELRFRHERRILARLAHPGIARLIEAGSAGEGLSYLAMEYVDGLRITDHCEQRQLTVATVLALVVQVCGAVAHAHRNLVVHCDIKPSNVIVTPDGLPRLLDFGIATLVGTDQYPEDFEQSRLTPRYAAPEQRNQSTITTATDVFMLGALLLELLVGESPNSKPGRFELQDWSRCVDAGDGGVAGRLNSKRQRRKELPLELGAIVVRALRPEPEQRYASAAALHEDLVAYITGMPIAERAGDLRYRARKFVRRHRMAVAMAGLFLLTLLGAAVSSSVLMMRAQHEASVARFHSERADLVKDFVLNLFDSAAPGGPTPNESAEALLSRAANRIEHLEQADSGLRAELLLAIGGVQDRRGRSDQAGAMFESAATLSRATYGAEDSRTLAATAALADSRVASGDYVQARKLLDGAQSIAQRSDAVEPATRASIYHAYGYLELSLGNDCAAIDWLTKTGEQCTKLAHAIDDPNCDSALLIAALADNGEYSRAEPIAQGALANIRRRFGKQHVRVADALADLALILPPLERYAEAESLLREAVAIDAQVRTMPTVNAAVNLRDLAEVLEAQGKLREARDMLLQAQEKLLSAGAATSPQAMTIWHTLAHIDLMCGDSAAAQVEGEQALAGFERLRGATHPTLTGPVQTLSGIAQVNGDGERARQLAQRAVSLDRAREGAQHHLGKSLLLLASLNLAAGRSAEALGILDEAAPSLELPTMQTSMWKQKLLRARALRVLGNTAESEVLLTELVGALSPGSNLQARMTLLQGLLLRSEIGNAGADRQVSDLERAEALLSRLECTTTPFGEDLRQAAKQRRLEQPTLSAR